MPRHPHCLIVLSCDVNDLIKIQLTGHKMLPSYLDHKNNSVGYCVSSVTSSCRLQIRNMQDNAFLQGCRSNIKLTSMQEDELLTALHQN